MSPSPKGAHRGARRLDSLGAVDARLTLPLLLLTSLAIWLLWQKDIAALLLCGAAAGLLWSQGQAAPQPAAEPASELDAGVRLMASAIVPAWTRQLAAIQSTTQNGTQELLSSFSNLMELQDQLETKLAQQAPLGDIVLLNRDMQIHCEQAMHGLQFGDRLAQMIDILRQDTEQFVVQLPGMTQADDSAAQHWLQALEARYTTEEQRLFHHGQPAAPKADKIDFF